MYTVKITCKDKEISNHRLPERAIAAVARARKTTCVCATIIADSVKEYNELDKLEF